MKILASLFLLILSAAATADSLRLVGVSHHIGSERNYNDFHKIVAYESDSGYTAGYFSNSYNDDSFFVGKRFTKQDHGVELALTAGLTYGYREDGGCYKYQGMNNYSDRVVCPLLTPSIRFNVDYKPEILLHGNALVGTIGIDF